jgi:bifunctional UDP-N-acetylglucosamine pyrophosphorylase/glucosamine-1-phosphate N-acetyltransferase
LINRERWTTLIPAAGRGSRLGYDKPKILYPIAGRAILEWLLDLFLPHSERVVLVASPDGRSYVEPEMERLAHGRGAVAVQPHPVGMGDAVNCGLPQVRTEHVALVWGDQVALRPATVQACLQIHEQEGADITCPTVWRDQPYIHFERDAGGRIAGVRQAREGDTMPEKGESDTGFFCFRTAVLADLLNGSRTADDRLRGKVTGELNLLPAIALASSLGYSVVTPGVVSMEETIGVNSQQDAVAVERYLRQIYGGNN